MKTINLSDTVMVSDPCYSVGTWSQHKLTGVKPGEFLTDVIKSDEGDWGSRIGLLVAVHKDYINQELTWRTVNSADIGVDSGQAGIFSMETYRDDNLFSFQDSEIFGSFEKASKRNGEGETGEHWYGHMCDRTLGEDKWGTYDNGVVSSTGYGDGSYRLVVAKKDKLIVGIGIDYLGYKNFAFNQPFIGVTV